MKKHTFIILVIIGFNFLVCSCKKEINPDEKLIEVYVPGNATTIAKDTQIKPTSATASENQPGEDILKALDGNASTLFHSLWDQSQFPAVPVVVEFVFNGTVSQIDYMLYHPRKDGGMNGYILEAELWIKSSGETSYHKHSNLNFGANSTTKRIDFINGFTNPNSIKLIVTKGYNDFVSASEFEFYKFAEVNSTFSNLFTDLSFSEIKPGVTRKQLQSISDGFIKNMALAIFDNAYEQERVATYSSYPDRTIQSSLNKTNPGGLYDNVTGIYVKKDEEIAVFVDEVKASLAVRVVDHKNGFSGADFFLNPGPNRFKAPSEGLLYIIYETTIDHSVKINIASGTINGYFDLNKHSYSDWNNLINNAKYDFFDLKGNKALLTFTTNELKRGVTNATRLVEVYDSIVLLQQQFMGLYKYNRVTKNLKYYRTNVDPDVYMHAWSVVTEYARSTIEEISNFSKVRGASVWGPAHETGHNHQTRPGLLWHGMGEVTVNIYSMHVQRAFGNQSRLQTEYIQGYNNRYAKAFAEIITAGIPHNAHDDVFCKLIPFWQLQLYFGIAQKQTDFYKDIHEQIRINPNPPTDGECQIAFVKIACDVAKTDLTEFFEAWGFLKPIDIIFDDYGNKRFYISQAQVDAAKEYIAQKGYPKPTHTIQNITDATVSNYEN
jgi:hypothetical protein